MKQYKGILIAALVAAMVAVWYFFIYKKSSTIAASSMAVNSADQQVYNDILASFQTLYPGTVPDYVVSRALGQINGTLQDKDGNALTPLNQFYYIYDATGKLVPSISGSLIQAIDMTYSTPWNNPSSSAREAAYKEFAKLQTDTFNAQIKKLA